MFKKLNIKYSKMVNVISSITIINVILAFIALVKDILLASYLGTTLYADAFMLAVFITDMIGNNLIAKSIGAASIPIFSRIFVKEDNNILHKYVVKLIGICLIVTIFLSFVLYLFRIKIVYMLASGFSQDSAQLCTKVFVLLLPTIVIYPIVAILIASIQIYSKFIFSALMPVVFNFIFLIGVAYCYFNNVEKIKGVFIISYVLILALVIMLFLTIFYEKRLNKIKSKSIIKRGTTNKNVVDIIRLTIPYLLIVSFSQGMLYFERSIASNAQTGSISGLNYAYRLSQFPIWVFVSAISTVIFPSLSKLISAREKEKAKKSLLKAIWFTVIFTLPLMLLMFILRTPIISLLFLRNSFDNNSLNITVKIFSTYCLVIIGQSITTICIKYFLAVKDIKTPLKVLLITFILNIVIDIYASKYIGLYSLGIGAAIANLVSALLFLNNLELNFMILLRKYKSKFIKFLLSNLILILILILSYFLWNNMNQYLTFLFRLLFITTSVVLSGTVYLFTLYKFKLIQ